MKREKANKQSDQTDEDEEKLFKLRLQFAFQERMKTSGIKFKKK